MFPNCPSSHPLLKEPFPFWPFPSYLLKGLLSFQPPQLPCVCPSHLALHHSHLHHPLPQPCHPQGSLSPPPPYHAGAFSLPSLPSEQLSPDTQAPLPILLNPTCSLHNPHDPGGSLCSPRAAVGSRDTGVSPAVPMRRQPGQVRRGHTCGSSWLPSLVQSACPVRCARPPSSASRPPNLPASRPPSLPASASQPPNPQPPASAF